MKKLIKSLFALAVVFSVTVLSSCGGAPNVSGIIDKHDAGETLTEADYSALIDYAAAAMDESIPVIKDMKEAMESGDVDKIAEVEASQKAIEEKYEHMDKIGEIIMGASEEEVGEDNIKKFEELFTKTMEAAM